MTEIACKLISLSDRVETALADINVAYAYAAATEDATDALIVLKTDNLEATNKMITGLGFSD